VVKVIWQKTASPPQTHSSVVFARWCQCALSCGHIGATWRIRLNFASFGPPESTTQTAIRSVQPLLHRARQKVPTLYKHSCVLPNALLSNALTETGICTSLKSDFYFRFHYSPLNKSRHYWILSVHGIWCWSVDQCGQSLKTAEIGIRTPKKSTNYFRFVWQTIGVDAPTFLSSMQNLVKIGKEFWT